eukprot:749291-Hanusia_phi.AAC.1
MRGQADMETVIANRRELQVPHGKERREEGRGEGRGERSLQVKRRDIRQVAHGEPAGCSGGGRSRAGNRKHL